MKKFIVTLAIAVCLLASGLYAQTTATLPTLDSFSYVHTGGHYGIYTFHVHDTDSVTFSYRVETNTNSTFTGSPSFAPPHTITVFGNMTITDPALFGVGTDSSYARVHWDTGTTTTYTHVTPGKSMLDTASIAISTTKTSTHIYPTLTVDPANGTMVVVGTIAFNPGFTSTAPLHTFTVSGTSPVVIIDTVPYAYGPGTAVWIKYEGNNGLGMVTTIKADTTLALVPMPTAHDSVITIGSTTYNRRISCNTYGVSGGYAKSLIYDSTTMVRVDSQWVSLTGTTGTQSHAFNHMGLTPVHGYIAKINVHDPGGDVWLVDTFRTDSIPVVPVVCDSIWYFKTSGYNGLVTFRLTTTGTVTLRYRTEVNDSMFTGTPHYSAWDTITLTGHATRAVPVTGGDTNVNHLKVYVNKIGSSVTDVTTPVMMYRTLALTCTINAATTHLYPDVRITTCNGPTVIRGELGFDSGFISHAPLDTIVLTTHAPFFLIHDTVGYTLSSYTVYWVRYFVTDTFGTRVFTFRDTTLPLVLLPYVANDGPSTTTHTSGTKPIKLDIYGSTGSYMKFLVDSLGVRVDSQYFALPSVVGIQTFSLTTIHRASAHTYTRNVSVTNSVGTSWIATDSFTTDPALSVTSYHNDTVKLIGSTIHYVTGYTNAPGDMNDMLQLIQRVGASTPTVVSTTSLSMPIGQVTTDFPITTPGTYKLWSYGHGYSMGSTDVYSDTTIVVVDTARIDAFSATPITANKGDTIVISFITHNADTIELTNNVTGITTAVPDSGSIKVVADTTTKYTLRVASVFGSTSSDITITVVPVDSTDTTTNVFIVSKPKAGIHPNPTQGNLHLVSEQIITSIDIYSMVGRCEYSSKPMSKDVELDVSALPQGRYSVFLRYEDSSSEKQTLMIQR